MPEYLTDTERGIRDAVVVHLVCERPGPRGEMLKFCSGEPYDNESTRDLPNPRVFCEACRLLAMKGLV